MARPRKERSARPGKHPALSAVASKSVDEARTLVVGKRAGDTDQAAIARAKLSPSVQGALTLFAARWGDVYAPFAATDINAVADELAKQAKAVIANDLSRLEAMLTVQAHSLDAMWNECARRARANMTEYPDAFDRYMRLALKAQSQCRSTIEALAEMKNPKPFIAVGQANLTNGPQQVNNGVSGPVRAPERARAETPELANKLLEQETHGTWLDAGAARSSGPTDSNMEAMAPIDGPALAKR